MFSHLFHVLRPVQLPSLPSPMPWGESQLTGWKILLQGNKVDLYFSKERLVKADGSLSSEELKQHLLISTEWLLLTTGAFRHYGDMSGPASGQGTLLPRQSSPTASAMCTVPVFRSPLEQSLLVSCTVRRKKEKKISLHTGLCFGHGHG